MASVSQQPLLRAVGFDRVKTVTKSRPLSRVEGGLLFFRNKDMMVTTKLSNAIISEPNPIMSINASFTSTGITSLPGD
jgi:hypothetical protein